jgi:hypothetical protein
LVTDGIKTFKIIPANDWFQTGKHDLGGVVGAMRLLIWKIDAFFIKMF